MTRSILLLAALFSPLSAQALSITYVADNRAMWVRDAGVDPETVTYRPADPFEPWNAGANAIGASARQVSRMDQSGMFAELSANAVPRDDDNPWSSITPAGAQSIFSVSIMTDEAWAFSVSAPVGIYLELREQGYLTPFLAGAIGFDQAVHLQPGATYHVVAFAIGGLGSGHGTFSMTPLLAVPEPGTMLLLGAGIVHLTRRSTSRPRLRPRTRLP